MDRRLLVNVVVAAFLAAIAVTLVVVLDRALTGKVNWAAIEALGSITAAVAAVLAVAALGFAADDLAGKAETERVSRMPYLRVDIGFEGHASQGFRPPTTDFVFDAADFNMTEDTELFSPIAGTADREIEDLSLVLWLTNLQSTSLGVAYDIDVEVVVVWSNPPTGVTRRIGFTYVAPGQTTAFRITSVRGDIPWLFASVASVSYRDIFGGKPLQQAHGALTMLYDRERGIRNERSFQLSRK